MTEGLEQVRRLAQEHGSNLGLVSNHSGDKDTTRMLGLVRQNYPDVRAYDIRADTGLNKDHQYQPPIGHGQAVLKFFH